jgi:hypothetical protein
MAHSRHDHRISAAQEIQLVENQSASHCALGEHRIFRPHVECSSKLLILRCSSILHCKC